MRLKSFCVCCGLMFSLMLQAIPAQTCTDTDAFRQQQANYYHALRKCIRSVASRQHEVLLAQKVWECPGLCGNRMDAESFRGVQTGFRCSEVQQCPPVADCGDVTENLMQHQKCFDLFKCLLQCSFLIEN